MGYVGVPFILKNSEGAIFEGDRGEGSGDHIANIEQGASALGPIPSNLRGIMVDP
jgi:hypothetical protein